VAEQIVIHTLGIIWQVWQGVDISTKVALALGLCSSTLLVFDNGVLASEMSYVHHKPLMTRFAVLDLIHTIL